MYKSIYQSDSINKLDEQGNVLETIPNNPTLGARQELNDWLAIEGNELLPADIPPTPEPAPEWEAFNVAFLADPGWQVVATQLKAQGIVGEQVLMGVAGAASNANGAGVQSAYNIAASLMASMGQSIPAETLATWQGLVEQYHIPTVTF